MNTRSQANHFLARRGLRNRDAAEQLIAARMAHSALAAGRSVNVNAASLLSQPWQSIGPAQVSTSAYGNVTGRVTAIAADPSDPTGNTVYLGTTGGGVWKSTNAAGPQAAVSFAPLTDNLPAFNNGILASLSIGAVSVQPGGTGVILAGTGDPNDALDSYYGSGLLRSSDGGLTWSLIQSSNDFATTGLVNLYFVGQAFSGFAWSTAPSGLVVAAVSQSAEGDLVDADYLGSAGSLTTSVAGLYYSTNAGQTWLLSTITDGPGQIIQTASIPFGDFGNPATAVVWNPVRKVFIAAIRFHGYYQSPDGVTFTRLANQPGPGLSTLECPANPNSVGSPACPIFRGSLAVQPLTGDTFALTVDAYNFDQGLWQDLCAASSGACASPTFHFSHQLPTTLLEDGNGGITNAGYNLWLAAVPTTGDTLLFAGTTDISRCGLNSGCLWRNATNTTTCAAAEVAPSQHAVDVTFATGLSLMYFGNDSGLWRSTDDINQSQPACSSDDANHFQNLNSALGSLAEVGAFAQDPSNSTIILAGVGVNGDAATSVAGQRAWPQVVNGYGSYVAIDPVNSQNWYAQNTDGVGINFCPNGSACNPVSFGTSVIGFNQVGNDAYAAPQPSPFLLDPAENTNLILGTCHIWLGPADGLAWSAANLLGDLYPAEGTDCDGNSFIQSLAASGPISGQAAGAEFLYAGMIGLGYDGPSAYAGHLFQGLVSAAAPIPSTWTDLWLSPVSNDQGGFNPQDFSLSSLVSDSHDATGQTIYATIEGFSTLPYPTALLYASINGGASWTNITSNLPDAPANSLVVDPNNAATVYIALDTGVYVTTAISTCSTQNCWSVYGLSLPNSPVVQLATFNHAGTALLRAATYGRGIWQIPLITAQTPLSNATATPSTLTFAPQAIQTQASSQIVTVTNTGTIPLLVTQTTVGGDFSAANDCDSAIAVGGSCSISVGFTPTVTGLRTATLTIYANLPGGQITVPITGTGLTGAAIVLLPSFLSFGSSSIGVATTPAQNVTISNTGGFAVNLQTPVATGDFSIAANTCSASLAPNFGCTVALIFTPTSSGSRTGLFSIVDDVGTQTATLTGIGVSPATDNIGPLTLSFAPQLVGSTSAAQSVIMTNNGDASLKLITIQVTGAFQALNGCGSTLIGHSACAIAVSYTPASTGSETGTLIITDIYGKPQSVSLTGSGLAPAGVSALPGSVTFGPWGVGSATPSQPVTLTNSGDLPLTGLTFTASGDFAIVSNSCSTSLKSGSNCAAQVVFSPMQSGPRAGGLLIASPTLPSALEIPFTGNGLGFTFQASGSATSTITGGQTATYRLQIIPATGSAGPLSLTCASAPVNSICTVNPATMAITSGVTSTVAVTIATAANSSSAATSIFGAVSYAMTLPLGLCFWPRKRRNAILTAIFLGLILVPSGCGVTASGGGNSPPTETDPTATPPSTYKPVITAAGPGVSQTVNLTLIVQ